MRFLAADERTVGRLRAQLAKASPYAQAQMTVVGVFNSLGTLTLLRAQEPVVDVASSLLRETSERLYNAEICGAEEFRAGMLDVADALLTAVSGLRNHTWSSPASGPTARRCSRTGSACLPPSARCRSR